MDALELLAQLGHVEPADAAVLGRAEADFLAAASRPGPASRARRRVLWLSTAAAATVAVTAGVALLVWPSARQPSRPAPPTATGHSPLIPPGTPLSKAVLIAFNAHADDILYVRKRQTGFNPNIDRRMWLWPIQPAPGQQQRFRAQDLLPDGRMSNDWAVTYPAGPAGPVPATPENCGMVVAPPRPQTGHVQARGVWVMPHGKIWLATTTHTTRAKIAPLRACLTQRRWRLTAHVELNGNNALEFTSTFANGRTRLWVDAQTYLPLRLIGRFAVGGRTIEDRFDYQFLPPSPANLAKLTPPIPHGFKRVHWHV